MIRILTVILFCCFSISLFGQLPLSTKSKKAIELYTESDNYRVRGQFPQAIQLLNEALEKDKNFAEAYYRLGVVYLTMRSYEKAIANFEKALSLLTDIRKQKAVWYDLGETYLATGEYEKALENLGAFIKNESLNKRKIQQATKFYNDAQFALDNKGNKSAYVQRILSDSVNRFALQYFPVLTADQQALIFTRRLGHDNLKHDEDLVISRKDGQGKWTAPVSISPNINSTLNEGTCSISADGRKLIFTSCEGRNTYGGCDLYESRKIGNEWTVPKNLGSNVNTPAWESQPSLSADGRTLYFVSERRGGIGRRDIYISTLDEKGGWTKAVNVGRPINSPFDEISPFIHVNNRVLYFSTNGLPGFGGFDIFYAVKDSTWSEPKNIGQPINNNFDQFSLFITADGERGYYSHEETGADGYSNSKIVEVEIPENERIQFRSNYVKGTVRDKASKQPLQAQIELMNLDKNEVESLVESDSISGDYLIVLTQGAEYALHVSRPGYLFKSLNFNYSEVKNFEPVVVDVLLDKITAGSVAVLNNIFFDVDKYALKTKSASELNNIVRFMRSNPTVKIEIGGHTDNSGSREYNLQLSEKRARSVYQYLIEKGIDEKRLALRGYGQDRPVENNDTEEGRQQNRRIEFKVVK
ncbi:MAG TPA: OmpA family protein [Ohtaekwangia sp.]|nr:OmpA family protein [Ohtaekwangia sp.]